MACSEPGTDTSSMIEREHARGRAGIFHNSDTRVSEAADGAKEPVPATMTQPSRETIQQVGRSSIFDADNG